MLESSADMIISRSPARENSHAAGPKQVRVLDDTYEKTLGCRLAVIEEVRSILGDEGIECPGVLVVGAQSAGKSSVLERLTGIAFPRGENTCTRFPTIVQLQTDASLTHSKATISMDPSFKDATECKTMTELQESICAFTSSAVENGSPISDDPIHIRYVRPSGPVMTLIDLPGITHVDPSHPDFDIHSVTAGMVRKYVENKSMVVLVVIPANDDFGNSEALRISQEKDEHGERTIGVISKCDLVPYNSEDIVHKIQMSRENDVKLSLGFIAVRNRSPSELDDCADVSLKEQELFSSHPVLQRLLPHQRGYSALSDRIVKLQSSRVDQFIPEVRAKLAAKVTALRKALSSMTRPPATPQECYEVFTREVRDFDDVIGSLIRGERTKDRDLNLALISHEYCEAFALRTKEGLPDYRSDEFAALINQRVRDSKGYGLQCFVPEQVFREMFIENFFSVSFPVNAAQLIQDMRVTMENVFEQVLREMPSLVGYPRVMKEIIDGTNEALSNAQKKAEYLVGEIIRAEKAQTFSLSPELMREISNVRENVLKLREDNTREATRRELVSRGDLDEEVRIGRNEDLGTFQFDKNFLEDLASKKDIMEEVTKDLQIMLQVYSTIVQKRLFDGISLVVRNVLMLELRENIQLSLFKYISQSDIVQLFAERSDLKQKRMELETRLKHLLDAQNRIRSLN